MKRDPRNNYVECQVIVRDSSFKRSERDMEERISSIFGSMIVDNFVFQENLAMFTEIFDYFYEV